MNHNFIDIIVAHKCDSIGDYYKFENGNGKRLHGIIATLISLQLGVPQYFSFRGMQLDWSCLDS